MSRPKEGNEALAAPAILSEVRLQSIVILAVSVMSLVGAVWIMASYAMFPKLRSFRHRLIIGLAISDVFMALNFLCSAAMNVDGKLIGAQQQVVFCSFNGFMTQVFVIQTDYWVLTIAVCTYFVLAGHKTQSTWVQGHEIVVWALPWLFSVLWASLGLGIVGYGDIGAWCWFTSDTVRLLVNFIPRWVIIVIMFGLYAYLSHALYDARSRLRSIQDVSSQYSEFGLTTQVGSRITSINEEIEGRTAISIRRLRRVARLMLLYPLAYAVIWSLPTAIRIYQATENKPAAFALQTIDKASIVIQGFVDAVIYGVNETNLAGWRARPSRQGFPAIRGMDAQGEGDLAAGVSRGTSLQPGRRRGAETTTSVSTVLVDLSGDDASGSIELRDLGA